MASIYVSLNILVEKNFRWNLSTLFAAGSGPLDQGFAESNRDISPRENILYTSACTYTVKSCDREFTGLNLWLPRVLSIVNICSRPSFEPSCSAVDQIVKIKHSGTVLSITLATNALGIVF